MSHTKDYIMSHEDEFNTINEPDDSGFETTSDIATKWIGLTKAEINVKAELFVQSILENGRAYETAEALKAMETFIKEVGNSDLLNDLLRIELAKEQRKHTTGSGAVIKAIETGTTFHFDKCGDPVLEDLEAQLAVLKFKVNGRKEFLKAIKEAGEEIRHDDELITIYPPSKTSISSYSVTLKKS